MEALRHFLVAYGELLLIGIMSAGLVYLLIWLGPGTGQGRRKR